MIIKSKGLFCVECRVVCHPYEQGLSCDCDQPWETEVINEEDYPEKWVPCNLTVVTDNEEILCK